MFAIHQPTSFNRDAGILLHPSSLPGPYGVGDFGPVAHDWIDLLAECGQSLWQVLPLGPAGYGDSPYQSLSAFAANPAFLSPESLRADGLLAPEELPEFELPGAQCVDFTAVYQRKRELGSRAAKRIASLPPDHEIVSAFRTFREANRQWLDDFTLFAALKEYFHGQPWHLWPEPLRDREPDALAQAARNHAAALTRIRTEQFLLHRQWSQLQDKARHHGIRIIGDIPIFVAQDSADVWCHRHLFKLNPDGTPRVIAGVPPDYFSATGQRWGNPLYDWQAHRSENFEWWKRRLRQLLLWTDVARIDHFRGFVACWEIPAEDEDARRGQWVEAPGHRFFESLEQEWDRPLPFIAEDLGVITEDVTALRDRFGLPGIRIMQFAFGDDPMKSTFIPESFDSHCVAYTGTHDNDTVQGWFNEVPGSGSVRSADAIAAEREAACHYFGNDGAEIHLDFIRALYRSDAGATLFPLQDLLGLGTQARMNQPGKPSGSWGWRLTSLDPVRTQAPFLTELTQSTRRGTTSARLVHQPTS